MTGRPASVSCECDLKLPYSLEHHHNGSYTSVSALGFHCQLRTDLVLQKTAWTLSRLREHVCFDTLSASRQPDPSL
jgi:exoribonuclease II